MSIKICVAVLLLQLCICAETFPRAEVKVIGSIEYGQTSAPVRYTNPPRYRAYEFNARPGERVEIWVHAKSGAPEAFLTDSAFQSIASGGAHFSATIPRDSAPATYYIVFHEAKDKAGNFTVELERP